MHRPFPATVTTLASWVAELGDQFTAPKTIKLYLNGIRSYQVDIGLKGLNELEAFQYPMLQRIITGIRRLRGEKDTREKQPITRDILLQILKLLDYNTFDGANLHAAFCLAFSVHRSCGRHSCSIFYIYRPLSFQILTSCTTSKFEILKSTCVVE